jgi:hypothetical protein
MRLPAYALEKSDKPSALDTPKDVCAKSHRPMPKRDSLITRLRNIGTSLEQSKKALALIGLGSVGVESQRLDDFSDLDFFAVVQTGAKAEFLGSLSWLSAICPIAYCFRNTPDGYKLLFADGIFCEFAVFEERELRQIPFSPGRMIWRKDGVPETLAQPEPARNPQGRPSEEWLLGEVLTNLYVGLNRFRRGEKLSAMRLIQGHAVDRLVELLDTIEPAAPSSRDAFVPERRCEERFPFAARELGSFAQGYQKSPESALAILAFLERHFQINLFLKQAILDLCAPAQT